MELKQHFLTLIKISLLQPQQIRPTPRRGRNYLRTISRKIPGRMFTLNKEGTAGTGAFIEIDPAELGYFIEEQDRPLYRQNYTSGLPEVTDRTVQTRAISGQSAAVTEKPEQGISHRIDSRKSGNHPKQDTPTYVDNELGRSTQNAPTSETAVNTFANSVDPVLGQENDARNEISKQVQQQNIYRYTYKNEPPVQNAAFYKGEEENIRTVRWFRIYEQTCYFQKLAE